MGEDRQVWPDDRSRRGDFPQTAGSTSTHICARGGDWLHTPQPSGLRLTRANFTSQPQTAQSIPQEQTNNSAVDKVIHWVFYWTVKAESPDSG